MQKRLNVARGFSLIEVMIAVAIIGIMAAVVGPSIVGYLSKGRVSQTKTNMASVKMALQDYQADIGHFPTKAEGGLQALVTPPKGDKVRKKWDGPYLEGGEVPEDAWGFDFEYNAPPARFKGKYRYFELVSFGETGEETGKDELHVGA